MDYFNSNEQVQLYLLRGQDTLYERGGLDKTLQYVITGLGFVSLDHDDKVLVMGMIPKDGTISLLPVIGADGGSLSWPYHFAEIVLSVTIDASYWASISQVATTTGALVSGLAEDVLKLSSDKELRYQPFSVYREFPGVRWLQAEAADEFAWSLLENAAARGVKMVPRVLPAKVKINYYSAQPPTLLNTAGTSDAGRTALTTVIAHYRALEVCLSQGKFQYVENLQDFATFYDCSSDVAILPENATHYWVANLSTSGIHHVIAAEGLDEVYLVSYGLTTFDKGLVVVVCGLVALGICGGLWKTGAWQHLRRKSRDTKRVRGRTGGVRVNENQTAYEETHQGGSYVASIKTNAVAADGRAAERQYPPYVSRHATLL